MKVGIVYRLDRPGGIQSCSFSLMKGLNRKGIIPDILWDVEPDWSLLELAGVSANFQYVRFPVHTLLIDKLPDTLRYLAWIANTVDGDLLRSKYDFFYIFFNGFLVSIDTPHLRYAPGPPLLPQLMNISPGGRGMPIRAFRWLYRRLLKRIHPVYEFHTGNAYVTISQYTAHFFNEAYGVNLPVIYPPVELNGRSFDFNDLGNRDTLTFFSRFVDYKRPEMVMDLANRYRDFRCVMMGGVPSHRRPYFDALQARANEMSLKEIVFLANPSSKRVKEELARTRFYIFPTRNEHFGMTTVEAIASGAVPYVHDSGGQKEIVCDPNLRFVDEKFIGKFEVLTKASENELNDLRKVLVGHIQQFSEEVFISRMLSWMPASNHDNTYAG